jgi:hypothetical protein
MSDSPKPDGPTRWIKRALLSITLSGLPELEHFPTPEARQAALEELATEAGNPARGAYWLAVLLIVVAVLVARFVAAWLLSFVSLSNWLEDMLRILAILLAFTVVLRRLHRSGVASELRTSSWPGGSPSAWAADTCSAA